MSRLASIHLPLRLGASWPGCERDGAAKARWGQGDRHHRSSGFSGTNRTQRWSQSPFRSFAATVEMGPGGQAPSVQRVFRDEANATMEPVPVSLICRYGWGQGDRHHRSSGFSGTKRTQRWSQSPFRSRQSWGPYYSVAFSSRTRRSIPSRISRSLGLGEAKAGRSGIGMSSIR